MLHAVSVPHCASRILCILVICNILGYADRAAKNAYLEHLFLTLFFSVRCRDCIMSAKSEAFSIK
jgi:hypothetical protein